MVPSSPCRLDRPTSWWPYERYQVAPTGTRDGERRHTAMWQCDRLTVSRDSTAGGGSRRG